MKTVISASRRTDIPAYYLDWFIKAVRKKRIEIPNPFYRQNIRQVSLDPDDVEWIVFWSRNYAKFLKHKEAFSAFNLFFHFTILTHDKHLERTALSSDSALGQMARLAGYYGPDRIIWRYDPVVFWQDGVSAQTNFNENHFRDLCLKVSGSGVKACYISIVTQYAKFIRRFRARYPDWQITDPEPEKNIILDKMKNIAAAQSIVLSSCCNDLLVDDQIRKGSCISGHRLNRLSGIKKVSEARTATRKDCGCTRSIDIGDYVTQPCYTGCIYCYANPVW